MITLKRGEHIACTNITIIDDIFVEEDEQFNVNLTEVRNNFTEDVLILTPEVNITIEDDDGM